MYEGQLNKGKDEQHITMAIDMAENICQQPPGEQNEMLTKIRDTVIDQRQQMIDEAEKNCAYLKETMKFIALNKESAN